MIRFTPWTWGLPAGPGVPISPGWVWAHDVEPFRVRVHRVWDRWVEPGHDDADDEEG